MDVVKLQSSAHMAYTGRKQMIGITADRARTALEQRLRLGIDLEDWIDTVLSDFESETIVFNCPDNTPRVAVHSQTACLGFGETPEVAEREVWYRTAVYEQHEERIQEILSNDTSWKSEGC